MFESRLGHMYYIVRYFIKKKKRRLTSSPGLKGTHVRAQQQQHRGKSRPTYFNGGTFVFVFVFVFVFFYFLNNNNHNNKDIRVKIIGGGGVGAEDAAPGIIFFFLLPPSSNGRFVLIFRVNGDGNVRQGPF